MWNFLSRHAWRDRAEILTSDLQCQSCGKRSSEWSDFEVYGLISPGRARDTHTDYNLYKILLCKDCYNSYIGTRCRRLVTLNMNTCKESQESENRVKVEKSQKKDTSHDSHSTINSSDEKKHSRFEELEI